MKIIITIFKVVLNIIYTVMKALPSQNKVVMLSRQSNQKSIDYILLEEEIQKEMPQWNIVILCKKLEEGMIQKIKYGFHLLQSMYQLATAKVCITDTYSMPISLLTHKKNLLIIQIWHALGAVKKFGYQSLGKEDGRDETLSKQLKMHKNYDYVLAPSEATKRFYAEAFHIEKTKVKILGMPRIDYILNSKNTETTLYNEYPNLKEKKTILYVPTFRKGETIKVDELIQNLDTNKYNLIIKLHPLDITKIEEKYKIDTKYNTYELMQIADYIITDYSAVSIEASLLNKPLFFYLYDMDQYQIARGLNINLFKEMKTATSKNIKDILRVIEENTYNFQELEQFRQKYVETYHNHNTKDMVTFIKTEIERKSKI